MAAKRALHLTQTHPEIDDIHIFTDCSTALSASLNPKPAAGQHYADSFRQSISNILSSNHNTQITLS
jgi:hypothetical protein